MGMLNAICCLYLAIVSQKPPPSCKSLELQKKLQYCYSTIVNLRWYCSSIVKQNNNFLFLPINICHFLSLHYLICSLSPEDSLSSLLSLVFVLQLLSPLLKPKTSFFSNPKPRVVVVVAEVGVGPPIWRCLPCGNSVGCVVVVAKYV